MSSKSKATRAPRHVTPDAFPDASVIRTYSGWPYRRDLRVRNMEEEIARYKGADVDPDLVIADQVRTYKTQSDAAKGMGAPEETAASWGDLVIWEAHRVVAVLRPSRDARTLDVLRLDGQAEGGDL